MSQLLLLDNEAVQALVAPSHPKHREVLSQVQVAVSRKRRGIEMRIGVPTTVRVEAGWDRKRPGWAFVNRLRIADLVLDAAHADLAAGIRARTGVTITDAHLGAAIETAETDRVTVVTSDPSDMRLVAGNRRLNIVVL